MKLHVVLIFALVAIHLCKGQNNDTTTEGPTDDSDSNTGTHEKSALQRGMDPIFEIYHNFLDTVMSKDFYEADTPFNVRDLINITKNNDYQRLQKNWQDLVSTFGGYAGCIIVGLIFFLFMPIVGCFYCCCHCCCHKCGGTREMMDPKHASCKRWTYTILLLIFTTFMLAGAIITFLGSELLHNSLKNEDNKGLVGKMDDSLQTVEIFADKTINEIKTEAEEKIIRQGLDKILPEIKGAANRTVNRVKDTINATLLLNEAKSLGVDAESALKDLKNLRQHLSILGQLQENISQTLTEVRGEVNDVCKGTQQGNLSVCPSVNELKFAPNFTALHTLDDQTEKIEKAANITTLVDDASAQFDDVFSKVDSQINSNINNAKKQVESLKKNINETISSALSGLATEFIAGINDGQEFLKDNSDTFKQVADYIWYTCIGLGCAVILVVFFYYLGVLYGLCGERPGPRAACCNRQTGAHLLCAGICFSFLFAWLLMMVVIMLFSLGGLGYSLACKYVSDGVENVGGFEAVLADGFSLNVSESFGVQNLTIAGMLRDCKENKGVYTALKLKNKFDLDKQFNLTEVKAEVRKMETSGINITNITLLTPDLQKQLDSLKNASLNTVNFTQYTVELDKPLFADIQLDDITEELRNASDTLKKINPTDAATLRDAAKLQDAANKLGNLSEHELQELETEKNKLKTAVGNLQKAGQNTLLDKIDNLTDNIRKSQTEFNSKSSSITEDELKGAVDDILNIIEDTVNSTKDSIENNIGKCQPLYDGIQNVVDAVCVVTLDPLNAIWFGLGWSLFFYIPCIIFAALLSNLYKRSEKYRKKERGFDDLNHAGDDDGYRGGRHDDNVPLTSMGKDRRSNGAYNNGYQGREQEPRYHREERSGYPPYDHTRDRGASYGGGGHHYAQPHEDHYEQPPHYDDAISDRFDRGYRHGGYPRLSNY